MLAQQKLEYTDFSAGISENTVPGKPNSYARADNLLITRDRHLETRPGSAALSDTLYVLPSGYQRVGALINFYNNTALLAQSGTDFAYQTGSPASWTSILGPTGGKPFARNTDQSRVYYDQWRQHVYMVSDSGDIPQVFYFDSTGVAKFRSLGLPRATFSALYTQTQLLIAATTLATSLVSSMISHYGDTGGAGFAHITADSAAVTALSALTTPTTLAQLITYVGVIKTYYNLHIADAQLTTVTGPQVFHLNKQKPLDYTIPFLGRYSVLNVLASTGLAAATTLDTTILVLNDLRNRYNLHTYSTLTHRNATTLLTSGGTYATDSTGYGKYSCTTAPVVQNVTVVDTLSVYAPGVTGNLSTGWAYANNVKAEFNAHLANGTYHNTPDTDNTIVIPDATDMLSATVLLAHLEFFYWWHYQDALISENSVYKTFTTAVNSTITNASATLAGNYGGTNNLQGLYLQNILYGPGAWAAWFPGQLCTAQRVTVVSNTTTALVLSSPINTASSAAAAFAVANPTVSFRYSTSIYHYGLDNLTQTPLTTPAVYNSRVLNLDYSLQNVTQLMSAFLTFFTAFSNHELSQWTANTIGSDQPRYFLNTTQSVVLYGVHQAPGSTGASWPESTVANPAGGSYTLLQAATYFATPPLPGSVLYTAVWRYNYTAGGISYENDSTPALLTQFDWTTPPSGPLPTEASPYTVALTNLPVLANATGQNWDTAAIVLDIYRTITNGTTFYKVGQVANGVTTFSDTVTDSTLITNQLLYTTGGVLQNDQPPASKFLTIMNNTAYYGYVTDITSGEVFPNRILQSISFAPYAVPASNYDDLDDALAGLSNFDNYVVAFCRTKIYRMEGGYDELGNGLLTHMQIAPTIGAVGQSGIVQTEYGIFFCGTNGIYMTDAFKMSRVSGELENTYNALIASPLQRARIVSVYDRNTRRVYFSFCSTPTSPTCDITYVLDLNWGLSDRMSFTTISGGASFSPTAWAVYNNQLIRGTSYGFLFKHDPIYTSDQTPLQSQVSTPSTQWAPQAIVYDFQSCGTDFGSSRVKKWATRITYQGQAKTNLYLAINRKNNNGGAWRQLVPVHSLNQIRWGDPGVLWNNATTGPLCKWGASGMIDTFRRTPAGHIRCDWMAVQFTNASAIIANSDVYGTGTVGTLTATSKTITLATTYKFPLWATLYTIAFDVDGYVEQHTITAGNNTAALTVADPNSVLVNAAVLKWQIKGVAYGQRFNLTAYNITWAPLADEQAAYHGPTSPDGGANA